MNNPFDYFDKIFCINLDERKDRWDSCLEKFSKWNIKTEVTRFSAVKYESNRLSNKYCAKLGCSLSHLGVAKQAKEMGLNNYLAFEDDFIFRFDGDELKNKFSNVINDLPEYWDGLYLGGTLDDTYGSFPIAPFSENLYRLNTAHAMHAVAYNKNLIERLASELDSMKNPEDWVLENEVTDVFMCKKVIRSFNIFISNPLLSLQEPSFSNIEGVRYDYSQWMLQSFDSFSKKLDLIS